MKLLSIKLLNDIGCYFCVTARPYIWFLIKYWLKILCHMAFLANLSTVRFDQSYLERCSFLLLHGHSNFPLGKQRKAEGLAIVLLDEKKTHTSLITVITQVTDFFCSSGQDFTGISLSQPSKARLWSPEKATGATLVLKTLMKFIFTAPFSVISYFKTNMSSFHYLGTKVKEQIMLSPTGSIIGQCIFNNYTVLQV